MDPFTQRMLEKAEQRSRVLGVSSASKFPLSECINTASNEANVDGTSLEHLKRSQQKHEQNKSVPASTAQAISFASKNTGTSNKQLQVVEKKASDAMAATNTSGSPNKVLRQFSTVNKENVDLGIEINIMMDKNVEVEVHVEEQDTTDPENVNAHIEDDQEKCPRDASNQPLARIRDASRNRLQRLGALYSKPDDLSSPIHRTEAKFSAEDDTVGDRAAASAVRKPKQRYGKLAALADSINQWEDDTIHHSASITPASNVPPPKPDLPSRRLAQQQKQQSSEITEAIAPEAPSLEKQIQSTSVEASIKTPSNDTSIDNSARNKTKQLKWDPKVINSLEAQGFQRRESNTAAKLAYEYAINEERGHGEVDHNQELESENYEREQEKTGVANKAVSKLSPSEIFNLTQVEKKSPNPSEKVHPSVKQGLVSGRAAVFENKAAAAAAALNQQQQRPQKDPIELPLKERMLLFEKNKGSALLPKAAFGMAPPINKIRQENAAKRETPKAPPPNSCPASVKPSVESSVRDKVAALVASSSTISENKIIAEINKQRQEDMQILANRFVKQREAFSKSDPEQQNEDKKTTSVDAQPLSKIKGASLESNSLKKSSASVRPSPPPPPPPLPKVKTNSIAGASLLAKRRSPGDIIDQTKRARKTSIDAVDSSGNTCLYPELSDLQSNESYTCGTTATPAPSECNASESGDGLENATRRNSEHKEQGDDGNCHDSSMNSDDDDLGNNSLGREVLHVVKINHESRNKKQQQHQNFSKVKGVHYSEKDRFYGADSSLNSSEASLDVDDYLDEALDQKNDGDDDYTQESEEDEEEINKTRRGSQGTTASNSFTFRKTPKRFSNCQTISEEADDYHVPTATSSSSSFTVTQPVTSELSVNQEEDNVVTLVHTVSFYRKQQTANSNNSTPVRRICREQKVLRSTPSNGIVGNGDLNFSPTRNESSRSQFEQALSEEEENLTSDTESEDEHDFHVVQEKIKKLLDEVCKQQQVIAQTSQALNLCAATVEFSGSTESVEGERHLLVATHRRQACLDEIQRLRIEKALRPLGAPKEKGHLTVKEVTLPLRQDYIRKLATDTISGHHLVCLLKYNEFVFATRTVPTLPGLLAVKFPDVLQLNNVFADFRVTVEIYGMTAQREILPHEVKYHINHKKTPKKKGNDNRLVMPPVQSPAGPNVVRTPALVQYGFAIFSLREIQRTSWSLTQVLGVSPLEGSIHMKVNCELSVSVEHKGFLTMFEDVSGFGAWHRRWCHLSGTVLNYWKYPDDEKKKTPMGSIDLYSCTTQKVTIAPRDICARLHTMLLECERPALETDQESLIIVPNGRTTTVRYLLSADTKEEREEWCAYFNKALTLLRAWGPPQ